MRLLLDTHVFLWFISGETRLPEPWRLAITDPANDALLSVASVWECVIKHGLGKLPLPEPPGTFLPAMRERHGIASLPIDEGVMAHLSALPPIHRDPFDRIIVAQAIEHGLTIVTLDDALRSYPVALMAI